MTGSRGKGRVVNDIRVLRSARGLTQQALADAAGATRQTIIAVEAGKYAPSLELAFRIAKVLEAPFEQVFAFRGE
ncbi:MAG: helix-turn-helix transcriptional regulator [Parvularculaceae bacterium]|nr:helix-turn-helix transcriptional regulator [Parvularculaceae bacterium]